MPFCRDCLGMAPCIALSPENSSILTIVHLVGADWSRILTQRVLNVGRRIPNSQKSWGKFHNDKTVDVDMVPRQWPISAPSFHHICDACCLVPSRSQISTVLSGVQYRRCCMYSLVPPITYKLLPIHSHTNPNRE